MSERLVIRPLTVLLVLVGVALVVVAIVYFVTPAHSLPSVMPGHQAGSAHKHTKHGIAAIGLAVLIWIGAWFSTTPARTQ